LANLNIKEEGRLRAQYTTQADYEREVRKVVKAKNGRLPR
jgi:predicted subunit of tRNA(5-methylaminomethyl-2-thiouridylate) methyltransferase